MYIQELRNSELESKPWMQSDNVIVNAPMNVLDNAIESCEKVERKGDVLHYINAV